MKKSAVTIAFLLATTMTSGAAPKTLTSDPLTGLPLIPSTDSRLHLGNEPTVLPEAQICKSKMETDFYAVFDTKVKDTVSWYESRLPGFKKAQAHPKDRTHVVFYKPDGSVVVAISGEPGAPGSDENTHSVLYAKLTPGLPEKVIIAMNLQNVTCP
jgi:hypothetical protein